MARRQAQGLLLALPVAPPVAATTPRNPATLLSLVILLSRVSIAKCLQAPAEAGVRLRLPPGIASDAIGFSSCFPYAE